MDEKSYDNLRAELLYDNVIENLLSLILSQISLKYSEVEEKRWQKIPNQLLLLKELRPTLFFENVNPELNAYKFSRVAINTSNSKEVTEEWGFLPPLDMNGKMFLKIKSVFSNKNRCIDASLLVIGAKERSFKIFTDFFEPLSFKPLNKKKAMNLVDWQRKEWGKTIKNLDSNDTVQEPFVELTDSYYVNCVNQELLKVKRLVKTISKDKYFYQSYPCYQALDGSQIPVNDFQSIHSYYLKLKSIIIEYRTLPWTQNNI